MKVKHHAIVLGYGFNHRAATNAHAHNSSASSADALLPALPGAMAWLGMAGASTPSLVDKLIDSVSGA